MTYQVGLFIRIFLGCLFVLTASENVKDIAKKTTSTALERLSVSCFFDSFTIPCTWYNKPSASINSDYQYLHGTIDGFDWAVHSIWYQKVKLIFSSQSYAYEGNLLLAIYANFKKLPVPQSYDNLENEKQKAARMKVNLPDHFDGRSAQIKDPEKSVKISNYPVKINFYEYHSPFFQLKEEGCIKFKLRGCPFRTNSDALHLWAKKKNRSAKIHIWSNYGPVNKSWIEYAIGLTAGDYSLSFNGTLFLKSRVSRLLVPYQIDDLIIFSSPCVSKKNMERSVSGVVHFKSPSFSNEQCTWVSFNFEVTPNVVLEVVALPEVQNFGNFTAVATYITRNGANICVQKIGKDFVGWSDDSVKVAWSAFILGNTFSSKPVESDFSAGSASTLKSVKAFNKEPETKDLSSEKKIAVGTKLPSNGIVVNGLPNCTESDCENYLCGVGSELCAGILNCSENMNCRNIDIQQYQVALEGFLFFFIILLIITCVYTVQNDYQQLKLVASIVKSRAGKIMRRNSADDIKNLM